MVKRIWYTYNDRITQSSQKYFPCKVCVVNDVVMREYGRLWITCCSRSELNVYWVIEGEFLFLCLILDTRLEQVIETWYVNRSYVLLVLTWGIQTDYILEMRKGLVWFFKSSRRRDILQNPRTQVIDDVTVIRWLERLTEYNSIASNQVHAVRELLFSVTWIDIDKDGSHKWCPELSHDPLISAGRPNAYAIAFLDSHRLQDRG